MTQSEQVPRTQALLKSIGKASGKGLGVEDARLLYARILDGSMSALQTGAALMAMRVRGESADEVLGGLAAAQAYVHEIEVNSLKPVVVIPTYNGARSQPNLLPLLACLISREGFPVLVHGIRQDATRVTSAEIFRAMGIEPIEAVPERLSLAVGHSFERGDPAFVPIDVLSPGLDGLLARRQEMGVRNTGHTLVKLIQPVRGARVLQLCSYTHAEFRSLQQEVFGALGLEALQSRGCEGEVVLSARRLTPIEFIQGSSVRTVLDAQAAVAAVAVAAVDVDVDVDVDVPGLPTAHDVTATAAWIQAVLAGAIPVPRTIGIQLDCVLGALGSATRTDIGVPVQ